MQIEQSLAHKNWNAIGVRPHHGINTPLFSLKSKNSCGIGEFLDLLPLIDWMHAIGFDIIQLLPLNDSGIDPSPYNAISANALNPIYISLHALHGIPIADLQALNGLERIDYAFILDTKLKLLKEHYQHNKETFLKEEMHAFVKRFSWVKAYASYKALGNPDDEPFYIWLQSIAYAQMHRVKEYAQTKDIFIKGDIPILVSPESIDVLTHSDIFDLSLEAGAPPDYYNKEGQRWGFPLYKFEPQVITDFAFWKERLKSAEQIFHLYRIDHIVGLFRLWGIPMGKKPLEGYFIPEERHLWLQRGETQLKMLLQSSSMLPVGEDLGIIPHETKETMTTLGIPGTKVIRWERDWKGDLSFIPYCSYPVNSMTTVSTHDSDLLREWWENHPEESSLFAQFKGWEFTPHLSLDKRLEILKDSHTTPSLLHINLFQEYLSLFPELDQSDPKHSRINLPGTISPQNWSLRYRPSIEEIQDHGPLALLMRELTR